MAIVFLSSQDIISLIGVKVGVLLVKVLKIPADGRAHLLNRALVAVVKLVRLWWGGVTAGPPATPR